MSRLSVEFIKHIRDEAKFLIECTAKCSKSNFIDDEILKKACVRALEVIGEAAKKVDQDTKLKFPEIEWRLMAGMRDKLIHDYEGVNYFMVWSTIQEDIPSLHDFACQIIIELEKES